MKWKCLGIACSQIIKTYISVRFLLICGRFVIHGLDCTAFVVVISTAVFVRLTKLIDFGYTLLEPFFKLIEILLVQKKLVLFVKELAFARKFLFAFGDCEVKVLSPGGFNVKEIRSFSCPYRLREYLVSLFPRIMLFPFFHAANELEVT